MIIIIIISLLGCFQKIEIFTEDSFISLLRKKGYYFVHGLVNLNRFLLFGTYFLIIILILVKKKGIDSPRNTFKIFLQNDTFIVNLLDQIRLRIFKYVIRCVILHTIQFTA